MKRISAFLMVVVMIFSFTACGADAQESETDNTGKVEITDVTELTGEEKNFEDTMTTPPENFVMISGGTFEMGSPETEAWRSEDET